MSRQHENGHQNADEKLVCSYWKIFSSGGCFRQKFQKRMADVEVQKCMDYLLEQKDDLELSGFGCNRQSVKEAASKHSIRRSKLQEYIRTMDKLKVKHTLSDAELQALYGTYQTVQTLADKKTGCFEVMTGIATLEEQIQNLSSEFDSKAVELVDMAANNKCSKQQPGLNNESMARTTQSCVTGVRHSWKWADEVMQCAHVHLANASAYHEFFHEVEEVDYWMNNIMSTMHLSFSRQALGSDRADLTGINNEMRDTLMAYLRWQSKVESLFSRARDIVPVYKRTTPVKDPCPVFALASYKTNEIEFAEGETLTLLNNSDKSKWRVQNTADQVADVPAVILLINGPTGEAIDAALRLKIQLLGLWTTSVKRLGYQMIAFMQLVFRDWTEEEDTVMIKAIQNMPKENRDELLRILVTTEKTLEKNWDGYEGFEELQERISRLHAILDAASENDSKASGTPGEVVIQVKMIDDLLKRYQEFWTYWETYKVVVEVLRQPKYILVCDKWDQLHYRTTAHFVRFWDTNLMMPNKDGKTYKAEAALTLHETPKSKLTDDKAVDEMMMPQSANRTDSTMNDALATMEGQEEGETTSTDISEIRRRQQLTTDEVVSTTEEVRHTFIIKSALDPRTDKMISLTDAVLAGIIDQAANQYVNIVTGETSSFSAAMANGDVAVEFKSHKKVKEEKSSYGIITVKSSVESRPYTILGVIDPSNDQEVTTDEAYKKGILNKNDGTFRTRDGQCVPLMDAIYCGMIKVEFHGDERDTQEDTKTYAVSAVVDQKLKDKVSFSSALRTGLLNGEEGVYVHNVTGEEIPLTEAIVRGFIKAKIITDTSSLNIDPTNKIVVRKLSRAKDKIVSAMKVAKAFRESGGARAVNGK